VEVLARIYFSINKGEEGREKIETFPVPHAGVKTPSGGLVSVVLHSPGMGESLSPEV
jgi:hypothetical protein